MKCLLQNTDTINSNQSMEDVYLANIYDIIVLLLLQTF